MGFNDHIDETPRPLNEFLTTLINLKRLDQPALGIAKLVREKGEDHLSPKQTFVFQRFVLGNYANLRCRFCDNDIPLNEAIFCLEDNEGYCGSCANVLSKYN
jgi:hypothetical protein